MDVQFCSFKGKEGHVSTPEGGATMLKLTSCIINDREASATMLRVGTIDRKARNLALQSGVMESETMLKSLKNSETMTLEFVFMKFF